jgi:hypothetical protein
MWKAGGFRVGLGKPTEMSLRDLLIEELKRRDETVVPEVSFEIFNVEKFL